MATSLSEPEPDGVVDFYKSNQFVGAVYPAFDPVRASTAAYLHGFDPAPTRGARLVEFGCATGRNLISLAESYPEMSFVGIDPSERHIERAQSLVNVIGLGNVELYCCSFTDLDESFGTFEYVWAVGLYSWVSPEVREHMLPVCAKLLAPGGVVALDFNVAPSWDARMVVRDLVRSHSDIDVRPGTDVLATGLIDRALAVLDWVIGETATSSRHPSYQSALRSAAEEMRAVPDWVVYDILAPESNAFGVAEFAADVNRAGLRYLADGFVPGSAFAAADGTLPAEFDIGAHQAYDRIHGPIYRFPYLVSADAALDKAPRDALPPDVVVRSPAMGPSSLGSAPTPNGGASSSANSVAGVIAEGQRVIAQLWPGSVALATIIDEVAKRSQRDPAEVASVITSELVALHCAAPVGEQVVELFVEPVPILVDPGDRPRTRRAVRVLFGDGQRAVHGFGNSTVPVSEALAVLCMLADGTRTVDELAAEILARQIDGELEIRRDPGGPQPRIEAVRNLVVQSLHTIASLGLLAVDGMGTDDQSLPTLE